MNFIGFLSKLLGGMFRPCFHKTASSLVEAPNIDNKPKIEELKKLFKNTQNIQEKNKNYISSYKKGYSYHMIAKIMESHNKL
jgi:esterase/lipase